MLACLFLLLIMVMDKTAGAGHPGDDGSGDCSLCVLESCTPSILGVPDDEFDAAADARYLRRAFGIINVDENRLILTLTDRSEAQRQAIVKEYGRSQKRNLEHDITDFTFTGLERVLKALVTPLETFYTKELRRAIKRKDRVLMIEIFTTLPPCVLRKMPQIYKELYRKRDLYKDIHGILNHKFPVVDYINVFMSLARGERDENTHVNMKDVENHAKSMRAAIIKGQWAAKRDLFSEVFTKRSIPFLAITISTFEYLRRNDKNFKSLEDDIKNSFDSSIEIYLTMTKIVKNQSLYFAQELETVLSTRWRVDKRKLVRILRGRCDIDLEDIKRAYKEKYSVDLSQRIVYGVLFLGEYHKALLEIIKS